MQIGIHAEERILITGKGQLGTALACALEKRGLANVRTIGRVEMDITDLFSVKKVIRECRPTVIYHTAALTKVDYCERNPEEAMLVNATGTEHVTLGAREVGARIIYFSTDYVFPGKDDGEYSEDEIPEPINAYGRSKLAGEFYALEYENSLVIRTAQVFAPGGRNFLAAIREKLDTELAIKVVNDEFATPTYAPFLAEAVLNLLNSAARRIYHLRGTDILTYYDWAQLYLERLGIPKDRLIPVKAQDYLRDAPRPRRAILSLERYLSLGLAPLPPLTIAISDYIERCK